MGRSEQTVAGFVLKGDLCFSCGPRELKTRQGGYAVCVDGVSAGVFDALPKQYLGLPLIDMSGKLVVPGLVDLHMHAPQFGYRGLGMDLELLDWLRTHTFPEESRFGDLSYARAAYEAVVEDLKKGPNTRAVLFATAHTEATELLMDLMEASGLVSFVGRVNMDRNAPDSLRERDARWALCETRKWLERSMGKRQNTKPILTPRFIPSCTDALMEGLAALQDEFDLPLQSHLSENQAEIALVRELCPKAESYTDAYYQLGMLRGKPTVMAHCVWNDDREIERLKYSGAYVAHCPQSNTNIASGIAPVRKYLSRGLNMGLGSDVAGGAHTSIFRAMTDAIQVSKLRWRLVDQGDAQLTMAEAFYMATLGGGAFFGKVGSFEAGYEFDAVVIDDSALRSTRETGIHDRLDRAAYLSDDRHIAAKFARGHRII